MTSLPETFTLDPGDGARCTLTGNVAQLAKTPHRAGECRRLAWNAPRLAGRREPCFLWTLTVWHQLAAATGKRLALLTRAPRDGRRYLYHLAAPHAPQRFAMP